MRVAAKQVPNRLDWSVLDVEPEEWDRRMADLGAAAAANGFPCYAAAETGTYDDNGGAVACSLRFGRHAVVVTLAVLVLVVLVGCSWWRTAQEGIARLQGDIANVVKLEMIQAQGKTVGTQSALRLQTSVQSVEFLDDKAMAALVVTRTLPLGKVLVQTETRFYQHTLQGWQQSEPVAAFWGPSQTLDMGRLRFVFGTKDRAVAEEIAPAAAALYAAMRRVTGQDPAAAGLLVIEIVPGYVAQNVQAEGGHIRLTSPLLSRAAALAGGEALRLLRSALAEQMAAAALPKTGVKAQWLTMVQAFGSWLAFSQAVNSVSAGQHAALRRLRFLTYGSLPLDELQDGPVRYDPLPQSLQIQHLPANLYALEQRAAGAEQLLEFIAVTYGMDIVPKLLQGFAQYEDWETLAPAVLGVSAAELEAAWHAARR